MKSVLTLSAIVPVVAALSVGCSAAQGTQETESRTTEAPLLAGFTPYIEVCVDANTGTLTFTGDDFHHGGADVTFWWVPNGTTLDYSAPTTSDACGNAAAAGGNGFGGGDAYAQSWDANQNGSQVAHVHYGASGCFMSDPRAASYPIQCTPPAGGGTGGGGGKPCGGKVCQQ